MCPYGKLLEVVVVGHLDRKSFMDAAWTARGGELKKERSRNYTRRRFELASPSEREVLLYIAIL